MLTKIVHRTRDRVKIIPGVRHIDRPLQVKYRGGGPDPCDTCGVDAYASQSVGSSMGHCHVETMVPCESVSHAPTWTLITLANFDTTRRRVRRQRVHDKTPSAWLNFE